MGINHNNFMESNGMGMNNIWSTIKSDSKKRNPLTNFVLYSIQIVSLVAIIVLLPDVFWSIGLLDDPDWNVWEAYGKGSIPPFRYEKSTSVEAEVPIFNESLVIRIAVFFILDKFASNILPPPTFPNFSNITT